MISLNQVFSDKKAVKTIINDNIYITVKKVKHDINGNPRYQLNIFEHDINITDKAKGTLGRYSKNGLTFQSYNLTHDVNYILNNLKGVSNNEN